MNFINLARKIDVFFLQKRFLLTTMRPELLLLEENHDLRLELQRKDELIKKHSEKIEQWKQLLNEQPKSIPTNAGPVAPPGNPMMNPGVSGVPSQMVGPGMQSPMQHSHLQQVQMQQQQQQQVNHQGTTIHTLLCMHIPPDPGTP